MLEMLETFSHEHMILFLFNYDYQYPVPKADGHWIVA